jgi:hypothetical protein
MDTPADWQRLLQFARERGWSAEATAHGYVRFAKAGSVVFGPTMGAGLDQMRDCARRLLHADKYREAHPR